MLPHVGRSVVALAVVLVCVISVGGAYVYGQQSVTEPEFTRFDETSRAVGFNYTAESGHYGNGNSGVYVADINGDNWPDVLAIGGKQPALFVNERGEFERSGKLPTLNMTVQGALFLNPDGEGLPDLLLLPRHGQPVYLANDGGQFVRRDVGLSVSLNVSVTATAADYDRDGDIDIFITQSGQWSEGLPEGYYRTAEHFTDDNGARNYLFERVDDGFKRRAGGIHGKHWTLAASFVDLTGDSYPDIHVANDFNSDIVYVNQRNGSFARRVLDDRTARNAMSSEVLDVNRDGSPDIFVTNIYVPLSQLPHETYQRLRDQVRFMFTGRNKGNNLLVNQGNGTFVDQAEKYGIRKGGWGWAAMAADFDNDGDEDLIHTTQRFVRVNESSPTYTYPMVFERDGDRFRQRNASMLGFQELDARGSVHADFDRDGDQDVFIAVADGRYRLYENTGVNDKSLQIKLSTADQIDLGATVKITVDGRTDVKTLNANADYQSQDTSTLHFGVGDYESVDRVVVIWQDGTSRTLTGVDTGQFVADRKSVV